MKKETPTIESNEKQQKPALSEDTCCELDPTKVCDNCFRCLETDADYASVEIDGIYMDGERII